MHWYQILGIVLAILVLILIVLYFLGRNLQKKNDEQQAAIEQSKMVTSILVIDKKKQKIKDSGLPKIVQDQVPSYLKWQKLPMVKAKIGPKITTLLCDERIYRELPVKQMVKIELAGMYITGIKGVKKSKKTKNQSQEPQKKGLSKVWANTKAKFSKSK